MCEPLTPQRWKEPEQLISNHLEYRVCKIEFFLYTAVIQVTAPVSNAKRLSSIRRIKGGFPPKTQSIAGAVQTFCDAPDGGKIMCQACLL